MLNINTETKNITAEVQIITAEIFAGIYAYNTKITLGTKTMNKFGICLEKEMPMLKTQPETFESELSDYNVFPRTVIDKMHTLSRGEAIDLIYKNKIKISEIIGDKDFDPQLHFLAKVDALNDETYEYGSEIPLKHGMYFDYINGINNEKYNIEKALHILQSRNDIIILKDKYAGLVIQSIPYYNATETCSHFIEFIWTPSDEDWINYWKNIYPLGWYKRENYVLNTFFGIPKE